MDKAIKIITVYLVVAIIFSSAFYGLLISNVFLGRKAAELVLTFTTVIMLMVVIYLCVKWERYKCLSRFNSSPSPH